jgi:hypothetical protein
MQNAIRDDILDQISGLLKRLKATFDPDKYQTPDDGPEFDAQLHALEDEFERIKRLFHDFLMTQWSGEIDRALKKKRDSSLSNAKAKADTSDCDS